MILKVIIDFFKYKLVGSIIILQCCSRMDRVKFVRQLRESGLRTTFVCDPVSMNEINSHGYQGMLYLHNNDTLFETVNTNYFSHWYKWLIIGDTGPCLQNVRYDSDVTFLRTSIHNISGENIISMSNEKKETIFYLEDVYVNPTLGVTFSPWGFWSQGCLQATNDRERMLRRTNLQGHKMTIATPIGHYSEDSYEGTFEDYITDTRTPESDSATRCTYGVSSLILQSLNATVVLVPTLLWSTEVHNSSMMLMVASGTAELSGSILRTLHYRMERLDYITPLWPFGVGFTYISERMSNNNMYAEPFTPSVWLTTFCIGLVLAVAQRVTSRKPSEKEGAFIGVLATWLQQDASAVPEGVSGRWTFIVMSISSMLVHSYYTSAIVSALMSAGSGGPDNLRALGDSRYAIASEDYDWIRYQMFDVVTNFPDLEYLKKKKRITPSFYQSIERGVELIQEGSTAFHAEYNQINKFLRKFSDEHVCKLQHVDTIPEVMTWITSTKRGQWTDVLRSKSNWLHETGLVKRSVSRWRISPPPCRSALLAERVKFGDVAPLLGLTALGVLLSMCILGMEIFCAKFSKKTKPTSSVVTEVSASIQA